MSFLLSSDNVFNYLLEQKICEEKDRTFVQVTAEEYKNFNLWVNLESRSFLVKQERPNAQGKTGVDFGPEWRMHKMLRHFPELQHLRSSTSEILHFDPERSILVLNYLNNAVDLRQFYETSETFPVAIAFNVGKTLAKFHQSTYEQEEYRLYLTEPSEPYPIRSKIPQFLRGLEQIGPGIFGQVCKDALEFWRLYQRYESLHQAMVEVSQTFTPCCLTHNDLNLQNILVETIGNAHQENSTQEDSAQEDSEKNTVFQLDPCPPVRLIDWEFLSWGDPAFDLAMVLSNYLKLWLNSLVISNAIHLETALQLAGIPLEQLQPSLSTLVCAYLKQFPEILTHRPDFLKQVMQFTGLILIKRVQGKLAQLSPFSNISICTLQVAKTLLCRPEASISMVFGLTPTDLNAACQNQPESKIAEKTA